MNRRIGFASRRASIGAGYGLIVAALMLATIDARAQAPAAAGSAAPNAGVQKGVITGEMFINFDTRKMPDDSGKLKDGSPKLGARDTYFFTLKVLNQVIFDGKIARQPTLYSKTLQRKAQDGYFDFEKLDLLVVNPRDPNQKKQIGRWTGMVPVDPTTGAYNLAGTNERPLRIFVEATGRAPQMDERFAGRLIGKAEKKEGLASYTYKRAVGGKTVEYQAKRVDPMKFENAELAAGPASVFPRVTVNGRLDYDYETGNWITDGLTFNYKLDGKDYNDKVVGSIKWIEPKGSDKGYYDFNLRFNEDRDKPAAGVEAAFDKMEGLDAFFAVDDRIPALTGRITYDDKKEGDKVVESKVTYALDANKLTPQQIMNFAKLWILCSGPANDE